MSTHLPTSHPEDTNPYQPPKTALAEPRADVIFETFRSIGYSLSMAVADIVDNSISADAKRIDIWFHWDGPNSWISVSDNGRGMNDAEIINAMRPGSHNPLDVRSTKDLGRFGLGLKTASFSQCRRLTLISRKLDTNPAYWCWSLDHIAKTNRWELIQELSKTDLLNTCRHLPGGTVVLWEDLDRLVKGTDVNNSQHRDQFLREAQIVKQHLAMVFHRFLEAQDNKIIITINDRPIAPWDPYLHGQPGRQAPVDEKLAGGRVEIKGYVLPHISKINKVIHQTGAGPAGWNAQQGFYIYRNKRLLVAGSWLNLGFKKEEHYKLARIQLDITNELDAEWQIDIKKSTARPPASLRLDLDRLARTVRVRAEEVYRHQGKVIQRSLVHTFVPVWQEKIRNNKRFYAINRDHPSVKQVLGSTEPKHLTALLRLLEETIPVPLIVLSESANPDTQPTPFDTAEGQTDLLESMRLVYGGLRQTMSPAESRRSLHMTEPFCYYPHLIEQL